MGLYKATYFSVSLKKGNLNYNFKWEIQIMWVNKLNEEFFV